MSAIIDWLFVFDVLFMHREFTTSGLVAIDNFVPGLGTAL